MSRILGCVLRVAQAKKMGQRRRASGRSIGDRRGRDTRRFGPKARGRKRLSGPEGHSTGNEPTGHRGRKLLIFEMSKRRNRMERKRQGAQVAKHTAGSVRSCRERKKREKNREHYRQLFTSRLRKASDRIRRAIGTVAEAIRIPEIGISDAPKVEHVAQPGKPRHKPTPIPVA